MAFLRGEPVLLCTLGLVGLGEQAQRGCELERDTISQVSFVMRCQPQKDLEEMSCVSSQGCPCSRVYSRWLFHSPFERSDGQGIPTCSSGFGVCPL